MCSFGFSKLGQKLHLSFRFLKFVACIVLLMFWASSLVFILYCLYVILCSSNVFCFQVS